MKGIIKLPNTPEDFDSFFLLSIEPTEKPAGGGDDSDSSIDFIEEKRKVSH